MAREKTSRRECTLSINRSSRLVGECLGKKNEFKEPENWMELAHLLRVASLGELSSSLAHELRQPLTAILSNAETAQVLLAHDNCVLGQVREILSDIVRDSNRATEVISRLHVLLKKRGFRPQPLDPNELIREVLRLLNHNLVSHAVRTVAECAVDLPSIRGDHVQLQQVLINLILNAVDAMSHSQDSRNLTLNSRMIRNMVEISVADTGAGIPQGADDRIFEPYYSTKAHGLGLGLSLSRSIVSAHGGRLWAENQRTGGAVFHCTLPQWTAASNEV
jgi:two-component system, LuxR family, sensor kinase FixL